MTIIPDRKITDILGSGSFTISAEIIPPRNGASPTSIVKQIENLTTSGAQFLSVTKGAGGSLRGGSLPIAQMVKEGFRTPCIAHFTCRDLLPEEVENQLIDHHFFGIRNILALRGDPPVGVENWQPREGSYPYAYQLVEQIKRLNHGHYLERQGFKSSEREKLDFCVGVACYPDHEPRSQGMDFFQLKVEAGAEFAISQMLFNPEAYSRFLDASAKRGIGIPTLPGTRILRSQEQALKSASRFSVTVSPQHLKRLPETDALAAQSPNAAVDAFLALTEDFKKCGAPGVHLFVLSDTALATVALESLKPKAPLTATGAR
jgi:methylenetetrahydrofolate reductase (NADPH)